MDRSDQDRPTRSLLFSEDGRGTGNRELWLIAGGMFLAAAAFSLYAALHASHGDRPWTGAGLQVLALAALGAYFLGRGFRATRGLTTPALAIGTLALAARIILFWN